MPRSAKSGTVSIPSSQNIFLRSEELDNASWTKQSCTVTADQLANPMDGAVTADLITETGALDFHRIYQPTGTLNVNWRPGERWTFSGYFKMNTCRYVSFYLDMGVGSNSVFFDLQSGVITSSTPAPSSRGISGTITAVGGGWYRCTMTVEVGDTITAPFCSVAMSQNGTGNIYASTGQSLYLFGLQLVRANYEGPYQKTVGSAITTQIRNRALNRVAISGRVAVS